MESYSPADPSHSNGISRDRASSVQGTTHGDREHPRPSVRGKFLFLGERKLYIRGVTYGTFRPEEGGSEYHDPATVERDFALMADYGINAVRTYTVPPTWLLDIALEHGLLVMVGLPWEQHIAFLDDTERVRSIEKRVRDAVAASKGHPAILCFAIGNEIPSPIVRWHGAGRIEAFLERLYRIVKQEDPGALVTYVNYPSTEYLDTSFADFICFNVYLESRDRLDAYLARLQNLAGDLPLVMAEIGLDSSRNGEQKQAEVLRWQVYTAMEAGCAGAFIFAWTDEWYRGGFDIDDWDFGLVTRDRHPKPALEAVARAFADPLFPDIPDSQWPSISVVVCSRNGSATIRDTMEGLAELDYPNYEVIVVDDGSTDNTAAIAREYPYRLISTENRGLSSARNTGMHAAKGEIVAYIDDDAYPDPQWLRYLAATYMSGDYVAVGGPNIPPPDTGRIADCVANSPGGPVHVLVSDREAEHIPGCNMSIRRDALMAIGGFDHRYRAAGDDVDVCWRLLDRGGKIGFSPAGMVWHYRRNSLMTYWKQQQGYGKAEALLEGKWPERYNSAGHLRWTGRLYGRGLTESLGFKRSLIYHGTWGAAPFQSIYEPAAGTLWSLPLMPEWYLVIIVLVVLSLLGLFWAPLLVAAPLAVLAIGALVVQAIRSASKAVFTSSTSGWLDRLGLYALTACLHVIQPLARLRGRLVHGLTLWRRRGIDRTAMPWLHTPTLWSEKWRDPVDWMTRLERRMKDAGAVVLRGGDFDRWDLEARGGLFGRARTRMVTEEHGGGRQMLRFRIWPRFTRPGTVLALLCTTLAAAAFADGAWEVGAVLALAAIVMALMILYQSALGIASIQGALAGLAEERDPGEESETGGDVRAEDIAIDHREEETVEIDNGAAAHLRNGYANGSSGNGVSHRPQDES
jgi:glycosyltransferase involved in cell wall biosynthesis